MKLPSISSLIHDKRGEIGTIAVLIGMVVVGLGILVGSQIRNQNINIGPRASANIDPLWNGAVSSKTVDSATDVYLWSNGGPTTGWESYIGNRAYLCNGKWCWTLNRATAPPTWTNGGKPFDMTKEPGVNGQLGYKDLKSPPNSDIKPWTGNGPTAAWTWILPLNGYTINETMLCNGIYCWRYIRYPDNAVNQTSGWRDGGLPVNMKDKEVWNTDTKMWNGSGLSVGWNDPINNKSTLCNESQNYCRSMSYANGQWAWVNDAVTYPAGVTKFTSAWTSPATNIQTRCTANSCYNFNSSTNAYEGSAFLIGAQPTTAPIDSCNSSADCMKCGSTCINKTVEMACTAMVQNFTCSCVSNKCVKVDSPPQTGCIPTLNLPTNNATVTSNPSFSWSTCSGSVKYRIEVTGDNAPSGVNFVGTQYSFTSPIPSWKAGSTYTWKVKSCTNADCMGGTFSNPSTFRYGQQAGSLKVSIPNAPTGAQWRRTNTAGGWDAWHNNNFVDPTVPVGTFRVQFADVTGYTKPSETSVQITNGQTTTLNAAAYVQQVGNIKIIIAGNPPSGAQWRRVTIPIQTWKNSAAVESGVPIGYHVIEFKEIQGYVKPINLTGVTVLNGQTVEKTSSTYAAIPTPTCIPSLISPANNGSITTNPSFQWSACPGTGTKYRIEVTGNATPNTVNFVGTTYSFTNPVPWTVGKTYTWKVKACPNADCVGGTFSTTRTFTYTVVNTPAPTNNIGPITLTSPINSAVVPRGNVTLQWSAATNATSYDWKINRSIRDYKTGTSNTTSAVSSLIPGSYMWQVTAKGAGGTRDSSFGEFKIPFSKIKPLNNTQIVYGSTYSFEWTPLLATDMSNLTFVIYNSTSTATPVYFKQMSTSSSEYLSGRLNLLLNTTTDPDFVSGQSYTWQLIQVRAGASQENTPPNDATGTAQSFFLVPASATIPPATPTIDCPKKPQGDANCDNAINLADYSCIIGELSNRKPTNCISSNFDNAGGDRPTSADYTIWSNSYNPRN